MTQPFRTASGGAIRPRPAGAVSASMAARYDGYAGDTLASALLANGVHLVGRSFKYHRPRGILSAGSEEPNALVTIDRGAGPCHAESCARRTVELYEGLTPAARTRGRRFVSISAHWPGWLSPLLSAGFYYKTFMWPASFWASVVRTGDPCRRLDLGRAPAEPDPDRYARIVTRIVEVLVIGGGPAGLAAADAAAARGDRVILCDEQADLGGSLLSRPDARIDGVAVQDWIVARSGRVTVLTRTTAFGWYPDNMIALAERVTDHLAHPHSDLPRERLWLVRAKRVVIATGAIERPMVFPGNDRPGIMLAGAALTYLRRFGVLPGRRVVVATSYDGAWHAAFALAEAGCTIAGLVDRRDDVEPSSRERARAAGIPVWLGTRIIGTSGRRRVRSVRISAAVIQCDTVLMSDGWTPSVHLFSQSRGRLRFDPVSGAFLPGQSAARERSVGACAGTFDLAACLAEGHRAGSGEARAFHVVQAPGFGAASPPSAAATHGAAFVDFQNDVTTKDLAIATGEGFRSIEHVKRYTTAGMATDQGKTANLNALATVAALTGRTVPEIGLTTFRPPYTPVTFGSFAGRGARRAVRTGAPHADRRPGCGVRRCRDLEAGALLSSAGRDDGSGGGPGMPRRCGTDLGLFDASTLGKIEVVGPDAAEFLNRMYTGDFSTAGGWTLQLRVAAGGRWFHSRRWGDRAGWRRTGFM